MFLLLLLISVTADRDDAHGRAGCVRDDDCLPLMVNTGWGHRTVPPAAGDGGDAGGGALWNRATRGRVLLHPFGALRGAARLSGGNLIGRGVPGERADRER